MIQQEIFAAHAWRAYGSGGSERWPYSVYEEGALRGREAPLSRIMARIAQVAINVANHYFPRTEDNSNPPEKQRLYFAPVIPEPFDEIAYQAYRNAHKEEPGYQILRALQTTGGKAMPRGARLRPDGTYAIDKFPTTETGSYARERRAAANKWRSRRSAGHS